MAEQTVWSTAGIWLKKREEAINQQINLELYAANVYLAMRQFFNRDDIAKKNISEFFMKQSEIKSEHVNALVDFHNQRGGKTKYSTLQAPATLEPSKFNTLKAMQCALALEENMNRNILTMHEVANGDPEFCDFIEANFLHKQVQVIKQLKDYISNLEQVGSGLGECLFDKHFCH